MPTDAIKKNNVTILNEQATGGTILFAHGFGTDQTAWQHVVPAFVNNYRVVLYDNVGAGKSDPDQFSPNKYDSLHSYADDLVGICEALRIKEVIMVAHSVSGMISVLASIKDPTLFSKIVLVGASPRYLNDVDYIGGFSQEDLDALYQAMSTNYFAWVSGFSSAAMANADKPHLAQSFANTLSTIRPDIAQSVARVIFQSDHRADLPKLDKKTLILQTKQDIAVPAEVAQYLNKHIAGSKQLTINAEGHFPHISAPREIINAVQNFI